MGISKIELLYLLETRGYEIRIELINDSKFVTFYHRHAVQPYKVNHSYSTDFTDEEIKLDLVWDLLEWTGLRIGYTLEY